MKNLQYLNDKGIIVPTPYYFPTWNAAKATKQECLDAGETGNLTVKYDGTGYCIAIEGKLVGVPSMKANRFRD